MAREVISLLLNVPDDSFAVTLQVAGEEGDVAGAAAAARQRADAPKVADEQYLTVSETVNELPGS